MTSHERMLAVISHRAADYMPCAFMVFSALRVRSRDYLGFINRQVTLGLDAVVELSAWGRGADVR